MVAATWPLVTWWAWLVVSLLAIGFCSACTDLFFPIHGDMTKDFDAEVGSPIRIKCLVNASSVTINNRTFEVRGEDLGIKVNDTYLTTDIQRNGLSIEYSRARSTVNDSGMYYCNIRPRGRNKTFHICATTVNVGFKPLPVTNFTCTSYYLRNITCSWNVPWNPVKTDYVLNEEFLKEYGHVVGIRGCPLISSNSSECSWSVTSQPVYRRETKEFHFLIRANNSLGSGEFRFVVNHRANIKVSVPVDFRAVAIREREITLEWSESEEADYIVILYMLRYRCQYDNEWTEIEILNTTSHTVGDLVPYGRCEFRLRAKSSTAVRPELVSEEVILTETTLGTIPERPPVVTPNSYKIQNYQTVRTIIVNFESLDQRSWNAESISYVVQLCPSLRRPHTKRAQSLPLESAYPDTQRSRDSDNNNNAIDDDVIVSGNSYDDFDDDECETREIPVASVAFDGLEKSKDYDFRVWSKNQYGRSRESSSLQIAKSELALPVPEDIQVTADSHHRYTITWKPPQFPQRFRHREDNIQYNYTVYWCPRMLARSFSCNRSLEYINVGSATNVTLTLPDEVMYQFSVAASAGQFTSGMEWTTCVIPVSRELDRLQLVSLEKDSSTSLLLHWQLDCNALKSFVSGYQLEYCLVSPADSKVALEGEIECEAVQLVGDDCHVINITTADADELIITDLLPNRVYRAVVRAISRDPPQHITADSIAVCASTTMPGSSVSFVIGLAVGGTVGLMALVVVSYCVSRWIMAKVNEMRELKVERPGNDIVGPDELFGAGGLSRRNSDSNLARGTATGIIINGCSNGGIVTKTSFPVGSATDTQALGLGNGLFVSGKSLLGSHNPIQRRDSDHSQGSRGSTQEDRVHQKPQLLRQTSLDGPKLGRNPSGDSSGCSSATGGHDCSLSSSSHREETASDSGTEHDYSHADNAKLSPLNLTAAAITAPPADKLSATAIPMPPYTQVAMASLPPSTDSLPPESYSRLGDGRSSTVLPPCDVTVGMVLLDTPMAHNLKSMVSPVSVKGTPETPLTRGTAPPMGYSVVGAPRAPVPAYVSIAQTMEKGRVPPIAVQSPLLQTDVPLPPATSTGVPMEGYSKVAANGLSSIRPGDNNQVSNSVTAPYVPLNRVLPHRDSFELQEIPSSSYDQQPQRTPSVPLNAAPTPSAASKGYVSVSEMQLRNLRTSAAPYSDC